MPLSDITSKQVNLPIIGTVSVIALAAGIGIIYFMSRRKKSITLRV